MVSNGKMSKKRKYKKRQKQGEHVYASPNTGYLRCKGVCPDVMAVQLKYTSSGTLSGIAPQSLVFRGNSVFDPDFAVGGQQAYGHDQWSAFYRRYRVIGSAISVEAYVTDSGQVGQIAVIPLNTSSAILSNAIGFEYPKATFSKAGLTGNGQISVSNYVKTADIRGVPPVGVKIEADYSAAISANPAKEFYWHVVLSELAQSLNSITTDVRVTLTYYVEYFDRETLIRS